MGKAADFKNTAYEVLLHVTVWGIILLFPYLWLTQYWEDMYFPSYCLGIMPRMLSFMLVFYLNHFLLVPRVLFKDRLWWFLAVNVILVLAASFAADVVQRYVESRLNAGILPELTRPVGPPPEFVIREIKPLQIIVRLMVYSPAVFVSVFIRMSERWRKLEARQKEAEKQLAEAELQNLRSQLNPHFLLNTLNNIYALIAFDSDRAQGAVQELSKLLRHVLYDNQQATTTLGKEADFMRSYIELMRIRLSSNVRLTTEFRIKKDSPTEIAPLIFISLIENAFKHGVSPTEPSFISITLSEEPGTVSCEIRNSNFPKTAADKSGSGIGLQQVQRRLDLSYPGRYEWQKGVSPDGREYRSAITLHVG